MMFTATASIRAMAGMPWPGFSAGGALWFPDLTSAALVVGEGSWDLAMGAPGLLLPLCIASMMITSIRIGFKASGAAAAEPWSLGAQ